MTGAVEERHGSRAATSGPAAGPASGLLRTTLVVRAGRVDLALPGGVPVAELLPLLAERGGLGADEAAAGPVLRTLDGRRLDDALPLAAQRVRDGDVLLLGASTGVAPPLCDVAAAVAQAAARSAERSAASQAGPAATALRCAAAATALLVAALVLAKGSGGVPGAVVVGAVLVALLATAARRLCATGRSVEGGTLAASLPAVAAAAAWSGGAAAVSVALVVAAVLAAAALPGPARHPAVGAPAVAGLLVLGAEVLGSRVGAAPGLSVAALAAVVVVLGGSLPGLAVSLAGPPLPDLEDEEAGPGHHPRVDHGAPAGPPAPPSPATTPLDEVPTAVHRCRTVLVTGQSLVAAVLLLAVPLAARGGAVTAGVVLAACASTGLRARHHRDPAVALLHAVPAGLAAAATAVLAAPAVPSGALVVPALLATSSVLLLLPGRSTARSRRTLDLLESLCLVAVPPLLVVAAGVPALLRSAPW